MQGGVEYQFNTFKSEYAEHEKKRAKRKETVAAVSRLAVCVRRLKH